MMNRRSFLGAATVAGAASAIGGGEVWARNTRTPGGGRSGADEPFSCDFAPHFGMFRQSAGEDLIDQLRFMAERGFRSLEDNGMKGRPVSEQERIASEMRAGR